jgi:hypothetical protein
VLNLLGYGQNVPQGVYGALGMASSALMIYEMWPQRKSD